MFRACRVNYSRIRQAIYALRVFLVLRLCACRMCFIVVICSAVYAMYHIHSLCNILCVMRCIMYSRYAVCHVQSLCDISCIMRYNIYIRHAILVIFALTYSVKLLLIDYDQNNDYILRQKSTNEIVNVLKN